MLCESEQALVDGGGWREGGGREGEIIKNF